jgi:hypothetical protein
VIRRLTPQERWELSRHTDHEALQDALDECARKQRQLPDWLRESLVESIEKRHRMSRDWGCA